MVRGQDNPIVSSVVAALAATWFDLHHHRAGKCIFPSECKAPEAADEKPVGLEMKMGLNGLQSSFF